ncbi:MAG TPA: sugar ABC transporter substrate-binding protein [Actinomycetota bacterium]|nr:sugar ABC transporter substrate-binding protein [Actinomycetota bacterium]
MKRKVRREAEKTSLRKLLGIAVLATALLAAACGGDGGSDEPSDSAGGQTAAEEEPVRVAFFGTELNEFLAVIMDGAKSAVEEAGGTMQIFDSEFDPAKQFSQVQDAIAADRFDAFIIAPWDGPGLVPVVEEAEAAGIPVVSVNSPIGTKITELEPQVEGVVAAVQESVTGIGGQYAELFAGACGDLDPCKVAYVSGALGTTLEEILIGSMTEALEEYPNIELLEPVDGGGYQQQGAYEAVQDVLSANPDVDVVGSSGDQMALGSELAAEEAGLDNVKVWGAGASCIGIKAVQEGRFYGTTLRVPFTDGELAGEFAVAAARGEDHPTYAAGTEASDQPTPITKDNLDPSFECQWQGA